MSVTCKSMMNLKITSQHRNRPVIRKPPLAMTSVESLLGGKPVFVTQFASTNALSSQTHHLINSIELTDRIWQIKPVHNQIISFVQLNLTVKDLWPFKCGRILTLYLKRTPDFPVSILTFTILLTMCFKTLGHVNWPGILTWKLVVVKKTEALAIPYHDLERVVPGWFSCASFPNFSSNYIL